MRQWLIKKKKVITWRKQFLLLIFWHSSTVPQFIGTVIHYPQEKNKYFTPIQADAQEWLEVPGESKDSTTERKQFH